MRLDKEGRESIAVDKLGMPEAVNRDGCQFERLRGVRWRVDLGILPRNCSTDDLRKVIADTRRRYATLRRNLLVDPHIAKDGSASPDLIVDNPLSQNPDSTWGRFFRNAELEKTVDQDLSRLYPEHGSYFQTPGCQGMLRRILLLWCLSHQEYSYRQGMHELLAPLLYVLHVDLEHLAEVRRQYADHFNDKFDSLSQYENDATYNFNYKKLLYLSDDDLNAPEKKIKCGSLEELDPEIQSVLLLTDAYGAEGELGIVLSEKFMEHDAYAMFDALMCGSDSFAMADLFSPSPVAASQSGLPFIIEASAAIYHLLSLIDSSLHSHLVELGVEPQYFALRWLRVLFGREFSLDDLLLIWDEVFAEGSNKLEQAVRDDSVSVLAIISSSRGALILGIAVSMILHMRSSLLATEYSTICLQRLLNFPDNVDLQKLISKAKSFQELALLPSTFSSVPFLGQIFEFSNSSVAKQRNLSCDFSPAKSPVAALPDNYWEDKWRVVHLGEDEVHGGVGKKIQNNRKRWSDKISSSSSITRTKSGSSLAKSVRESRSSKTSARRSLLEDLSHQLGMDDGVEEITCAILDDQQSGELSTEGSDSLDRVSSQEEIRQCGLQEISFVCTEAAGSNACENESIKSSSASNACDEDIQEEIVLPVSHLRYPADTNVESSVEPTTKVNGSGKDRKPFSNKFHWLWKFGRNSPDVSAKGTSTADRISSAHGAEANTEESSSVDESSQSSRSGREGLDQNVMDSLRNLGQSMLEHIQIVESVFQQDRAQIGPLENFSKNVLVGKGQVTAMAALKELRKISNLLSEM